MAVLVTGGLGYIGSHTVVELLEKEYEVVIVDNLSNSKKEVLDRIEGITGKKPSTYLLDLLEKSDLEMIFDEHDIEAVIHFAGLKAVGESVEQPLKYYTNNLISTLNLCEIMFKYNVFNLIFSSSATVYGIPEKLPITEEASTGVLNPYGRTKLMIEEILRDLVTADKRWKIVLLRYFNPVGAHESGLIGEDPQGIPNNLMPFISQVAFGKLDKLKVYGGDYPTHDGTGVRDYIHVVDLAKGHLAALDKLDMIKNVESINLGTGRGYSVLEVVKAFEKVASVAIPYEIVNRREGDTAICYANPKKALELLSWKAERDIYEMCEDSWRWQQLNQKVIRN